MKVKKKWRNLFAILLSGLMMVSSLTAYISVETVRAEEESFTWEDDNGTYRCYTDSKECTVTSYDYSSHNSYDVEIPSSIYVDGIRYIVTGIGAYAFSGMSMMSVTFPDSLQNIGEYAFYKCNNVTEIILPDGLKSLERFAFRGCERLTKVTLPESLQIIEGGAFEDCFSLTDIALPKNLKILKSSVFCGCENIREIVIPDGINYIDMLTFSGCSSLESIRIPASVTAIDSLAFRYCDKLTIYCFTNSAAFEFAEENDIPYVLLTQDIVNTPTPAPSSQAAVATNSPIPTKKPSTTKTPTYSSSYDDTDDEEATVMLKKKILRIKKGKKCRIRIKKKASWDYVVRYRIVGKKKIVKVSRRGVVKGLRKGKTNVKVIMASGASAKCKIIVRR